MAVVSAAEQDQVKHGELDRVLCGKRLDERLLVGIGEFLGVVKFLYIDGDDNGRSVRGGDLVEELLLQQAVVAVWVVQRHGALVSEEDFPSVPDDLGRVQELV